MSLLPTVRLGRLAGWAGLAGLYCGRAADTGKRLPCNGLAPWWRMLPTLGTTQPIQAQLISQALLGECLHRKNGGDSVRTFFALRRVQQRELLDLL